MERPLRLVPAVPIAAEDAAPASTETTSELLTFLFADVRNYTRFTAERGDEVGARLAARFAAVTREEVAARGGEVIELRGDEALAVFSSARQALRTGVALQERFAVETRTDPTLPLTVGIGLDAGEAVPVEGGYRGGALNLGARLCALAAAGEILASEGVIHLARKVEGLEYHERGAISLKGFDDPVRVIQVSSSAGATVDSSQPSASPGPAETEPEQRLPIGGFLGSLPSGGLVGREEELRHVLVALDAVAGGEGRLLLLAGDTGVGKTRLAQEVTLMAHNYGFLLAVGRCYEPQQAIPFYPFLEALSMLYAAAPIAVRDQAGQRWPYLARLLTDQLDSAIPASSDSPEEQERLFRAVSRFLEAIAETRPVALLLDDLHWSDSASLQLVQHLARRTRGSAILLLGIYRDAEVGSQHPLEVALRDLGREHLADRVAVKPLHEGETAILINETLGELESGGEFASLIYRHTDGNPFFVQQILHTLVETGSVFRENGHWRRHTGQEIELPDSVRSVISQRVSRLSASAQEVLQEASALGQVFTFDDLQQMKALTDEGPDLESRLDAALTEAAAMRLIRVAGRDDYAFQHALTQQTLYAELSPRRRRRLHLAAGEALERLPEAKRQSRAGELAWHFLQGDDEKRAQRYATLAGDQAEEVFAHDEAETHYRAALELVSADEPAIEAGLREKLGTVQRLRGQYREALELLEGAAGMFRQAGDVEAEGRVAAQIGLIDALTGQCERGIARLQPLARALEDRGPSNSLALLYSGLLKLFSMAGREREFDEASEHLLGLAKALGDERLLAEAELHRGTSLIRSGDFEQALAMLEGAIERAGRVGDLPTQCAVLNFAAVIYHSRQDFDRALTYRVRAVEVAERLGDPWEISYRAVEAAYGTFLLGNWGRSREFAELSLRAALSLDELRMYLQPLYALGELSLYEGRWEEAAHYLDEAIVIARHLGVSAMIREVEGLRAEQDILRGDFDAAMARLRPLLESPDWEDHLNFLLPLAWAYLEVGEIAGAEDAAAKAGTEAARQRSPVGQIETLRIQGVIASRQGKWQEAEDRFRRALVRSDEISYPWGEARALYGLGLMYGRRGDRKDAGEHLGQADAVFRRLGAEAYQARVADSLRQFSEDTSGPA